MSTPPGEPALADVQRDYPRWRCWRGICGLYYACRAGAGPGQHAEVTGEDPLDLRDQIRRAEALHDHTHEITHNDGNGSPRCRISRDPGEIHAAHSASQPASPGQGG